MRDMKESTYLSLRKLYGYYTYFIVNNTIRIIRTLALWSPQNVRNMSDRRIIPLGLTLVFHGQDVFNSIRSCNIVEPGVPGNTCAN